MSVPLPRLQRRYRVSKPQKQENWPAEIAAPSDKIKDAVSFLTLLLELDVHVFSSSFHAKTQPSRTGAGATFAVGQFKLHFNDLGFDETDTYEDGNTMRGGRTSYGDVVVTKRIATSGYSNDASRSAYSSAIRPLVQELRVLSHPYLRDHQNIIDLFGVAWEKHADWTGHCWPIVVLEYADHGNIHDFFAAEGAGKGWMTRLGFCHDVIEGLCALHDAGVIHGDLKGENTLIFKRSNGKFGAKLCDFGYAIVEDDYEDPAAVISIPGLTPRWAAPELRHGFVSLARAHMADVYSLGLLLTIVIQHGISPFSINVSSESPHQYNT
jgi:serine/threonine protein kinase